MEKEIYTTLIYKSLKGEITTAEKEQLDALTQKSENYLRFREEIEWTWELSHPPEALPDIDVEADLKKVKLRMVEKVEAAPKTATKLVPIWKRMSSIAASLALLCVASYAIYQFMGSSSMKSIVADKGVKHLQLTDGTNVWLNEGSRLDFPSQFDQNGRAVSLSGEAYFEVEHNAAAPFSIAVGESEIRVLGTSFNIAEQRKEQQLVVSVQTGKVRLTNDNGSVDLTKNEQGVYDYVTKTVEKKSANTQNEIVWKTGKFVFRSARLEDIIDKVEREFKVDIQIQNKELYDCELSAIVNKTNLREVLDIIAKYVRMGITEQNESTFILTNGECQ